jgi:hypothetical protein
VTCLIRCPLRLESDGISKRQRNDVMGSSGSVWPRLVRSLTPKWTKRERHWPLS